MDSPQQWRVSAEPDDVVVSWPYARTLSTHYFFSPSFSTLKEFRQREVEHKEMVLAPWLPYCATAMIAGVTGLGKTYLGLAIAYAIAGGGAVLGWETGGKPRKVLYVDGEMPTVDMQERLNALHQAAKKDGNGDPEAADANLFIIHACALEDGIPNLQEDAGQRFVEKVLKETGAEVLVLDNLSCLFYSEFSENDDRSWVAPQQWLLKLRRKGITTIYLHHTGKPNEDTGLTKQRGTSKREDTAYTSILLQPCRGRQKPDSGFEITFKKHRGLHPNESASFDVRIEDKDGECRLLRHNVVEQARALMQLEGLNQTEAAKRLGISQGHLSKLLKAAKGADIPADSAPE